MKKYLLKYLILTLVISLFSSCEKELKVFSAGEGLNFYYETSADTLIHYSFVYGPTTAVKDTIWLKVETIGPLSAKSREITVEQIATGLDDAVAGTHYVSFDDASLKEFYKMPANTSIDSIPIVLKRDASLKEKEFNLLIKIKPNSVFKLVNPDRNHVQIIFSDKLSRPSRWAYYCERYFGVYGPVKHQWLIEQTGNKWDDDYLGNVLGFTSSNTYENGTNSNYDSGFCSYLVRSLTNKLLAYNAARMAQGLDVLKEADGTIVAFE